MKRKQLCQNGIDRMRFSCIMIKEVSHFSEVLALRFSYLVQKTKRRELRRMLKEEDISEEMMVAPNKSGVEKEITISKLQYDDVVFDISG
ncbi:hypothetical protein ABFV83_10055 [Lacrimispora sp. BS-2]|uniref:Uncharacterized protein n=1 Tax=Lacrimispora sp. BS-2 TaxID=3151850 RepID=A0AAU7PUK8_9FIRM